mmetsp:Transcript_103596/g.302349  ORF Transcript_103596/g.302349 Transcript_103596/m.302349 type:complete len:319 (-) Transcript_103596:263-1219(-)
MFRIPMHAISQHSHRQAQTRSSFHLVVAIDNPVDQVHAARELCKWVGVQAMIARTIHRRDAEHGGLETRSDERHVVRNAVFLHRRPWLRAEEYDVEVLAGNVKLYKLVFDARVHADCVSEVSRLGILCQKRPVAPPVAGHTLCVPKAHATHVHGQRRVPAPRDIVRLVRPVDGLVVRVVVLKVAVAVHLHDALVVLGVGSSGSASETAHGILALRQQLRDCFIQRGIHQNTLAVQRGGEAVDDGRAHSRRNLAEPSCERSTVGAHAVQRLAIEAEMTQRGTLARAVQMLKREARRPFPLLDLQTAVPTKETSAPKEPL